MLDQHEASLGQPPQVLRHRRLADIDSRYDSPTDSGRRSRASRFKIWIRGGSARERNQLAYSSASFRPSPIVYRR